MSESLLIGKAKELFVATLLVARKLHVYFPLVDSGFDLVVGSRDGTLFVPVQVKYKEKRTGFTLKRDDAEKFAKAEAILVFCSGERVDEEEFYFFPAREWLARAQDRARKDDMLVVYAKTHRESADWASQYCGQRGIDATFKSLLERNALGKASTPTK